MVSILKKLIEYEGTADSIPNFTEKTNAFKEFNVEELLELPCTKPDIEQIIKVKAEINIMSIKIIKTPVALSLERQNLTGWKAIIEGEVKQVVQYVADEPYQRVHGAHFSIPFSTFIVLPPDFEEGDSFDIDVYIEDIFAEKVDNRKMFKNVTILIVGKIIE